MNDLRLILCQIHEAETAVPEAKMLSTGCWEAMSSLAESMGAAESFKAAGRELKRWPGVVCDSFDAGRSQLHKFNGLQLRAEALKRELWARLCVHLTKCTGTRCRRVLGFTWRS